LWREPRPQQVDHQENAARDEYSRYFPQRRSISRSVMQHVQAEDEVELLA